VNHPSSLIFHPLSGSTAVVGVFGYPVAHSPVARHAQCGLRRAGLELYLCAFPVSPDALGVAIRGLPALGIVGVNLTIPHKESVMPFLDEVTAEARAVGAVTHRPLRRRTLAGR